MSKTDLDIADRQLLNLLQSDFPLVPQPFAVLAERLGLKEEEALERSAALRRSGILRHLSAIFDAHRVGYRSTLVSFAVPPERLQAAADIVSAHPGVSHNYGREHEYNLWFVLAVPRDSDLESIVADMAERARVLKYHILPALKLYKIDVELDAVSGGGNRGRSTGKHQGPRRPLTDEEVQLVRVLQEDLPLVSHPFTTLAVPLDMSDEELLAKARALQEEGIMRRFAAVIRHRAVGFSANGMTCWVVPEEVADETGQRFASYPQVSHCYRRPTFEDWPYNVYTMIHAQSREKCEETVQGMAREVGVDEYRVLYSHTEYKKERVKYFVE